MGMLIRLFPEKAASVVALTDIGFGVGYALGENNAEPLPILLRMFIKTDFPDFDVKKSRFSDFPKPGNQPTLVVANSNHSISLYRIFKTSMYVTSLSLSQHYVLIILCL